MRANTRTRRAFIANAGAMSAVAVVAACAAPAEVVVTQIVTPGQATESVLTVPNSSTTSRTSTTTSSAANAVRIISSPKFGAVDVAPSAPITITSFNAKITELTVVGSDGAAVAGTIDPNGSTWTLTERLKFGQTYTFTGAAADASGAVTPITGQLTTVNPSSTVGAGFTTAEGATYGVGQPIVLIFSGQVVNRADAEKALKVTTDKGDIVGSWGWLQDEDIQAAGVLQSQVHWRPKDFWPANTKVTVHADLYGVDYGNGNWGSEDMTRSFTIGRALIATADVNSFRLKVSVDGTQVRDYPVSYGKATDLRRQTRSGIHVVQEKYPDFDMCNSQFAYCGVKVKWAVRINNNGEFIHENDSTIKYQGVANVSHGCVNMSTANAKDFYDLCLFGDPVIVSGTEVQLSAADYIYDWAFDYATWKTYSAL